MKSEKSMVINSTEELSNYLTQETRELLNFVYDGIYVVDTKRKIVFWNKMAATITGYKACEVMGKSCKDDILNHIDENGVLVCKEDCPLLRAIYFDTQSEAKLYPLHKDKHRFPVSTHIGPIKNKNGRIIGAIEVFRDISTEERLHILQKKFEKLIKQYVSKTTYERIVESVSKDVPIMATYKELSILFIDIVGFTTISEKHKADEVVDILNSYFTLATQMIKQNLGDIDKFIGDCVMAVFIDAEDAVNVAKNFLFQGLPTLNNLLKSKGLPQINVRIGINTGKLVHGDIGSDDRKDMTVIGDAVNTASRIESLAEPGNFMISEGTLVQIKNQQEFEFAQEIQLRGKKRPIKLYRFKKKANLIREI